MPTKAKHKGSKSVKGETGGAAGEGSSTAQDAVAIDMGETKTEWQETEPLNQTKPMEYPTKIAAPNKRMSNDSNVSTSHSLSESQGYATATPNSASTSTTTKSALRGSKSVVIEDVQGEPTPTTLKQLGTPIVVEGFKQQVDSSGNAADLVASQRGSAGGFRETMVPRLAGPQQKCIDNMMKLQAQHEELTKQLKAEQMKLKSTFEERFKELYEKRRVLLEVNESLLEKNSQEKSTSEIAADASSDVEPPPDFWLVAMLNHEVLNLLVEQWDVAPLQYLQNVSSEWLDDTVQESFRLKFSFAKNPYFEQTVLEKAFRMEYDDEVRMFVLNETMSVPPIWYPGMDVTSVQVKRRQVHIRTNVSRIITETRPRESFFNFFRSTKLPEEAQLEVMSPDEAKMVQVLLTSDFEAGIAFRDAIIPQAVNWYLGKLKVVIEEPTEGQLEKKSEQQEEGFGTALLNFLLS